MAFGGNLKFSHTAYSLYFPNDHHNFCPSCYLLPTRLLRHVQSKDLRLQPVSHHKVIHFVQTAAETKPQKSISLKIINANWWRRWGWQLIDYRDPKEHTQWPPRRRARTTIDVAKTDGQYITIRSFLLIQGVVDFGEGPGNLRPSGQTTVAKATCQLEWRFNKSHNSWVENGWWGSLGWVPHSDRKNYSSWRNRFWRTWMYRVCRTPDYLFSMKTASPL